MKTDWQLTGAGVLSTLQDRGRYGYRQFGVAPCGALNPDAAALANQLVGNDIDAAVLEMTLHGPTLRLPHAARIAWVGANVRALSRGVEIPGHRPVWVPAGKLELGAITGGVRAWLAVAGGFQCEPVLGSRSTDLRGAFGGVQGRALRAGDRLTVSAQKQLRIAAPVATKWWIGGEEVGFDRGSPIRFVPADGMDSVAFCEQDWQVSPDSNRQGLRLRGNAVAAVAHHALSEPVAMGCIQLPPDGLPIILLADAQTVGGYARLGYVIPPDLARLAQAGPRDRLSFQAIEPAQAAGLALRRRNENARAGLAIRERLASLP